MLHNNTKHNMEWILAEDLSRNSGKIPCFWEMLEVIIKRRKQDIRIMNTLKTNMIMKIFMKIVAETEESCEYVSS